MQGSCNVKFGTSFRISLKCCSVVYKTLTSLAPHHSHSQLSSQLHHHGSVLLPVPGQYEKECLNFIYFTTITKQAIQLILIMLVGTDVCVRMFLVWEETGVPGGNPPVWLGDYMTISHADAGYRTWVAAVRGECVNTAPARQPKNVSMTHE